MNPEAMPTEGRMKLLLTTVATRDEAGRVARYLAEAQYAACVSAVDLAFSLYRWEGDWTDQPEVLLMVKTPADRVEAATHALLQVHPYETPEVLALDADALHVGYMAWALERTAHPGDIGDSRRGEARD